MPYRGTLIAVSRLRPGDSSSSFGTSRIDIAVNERGSSAVVKKLNQLADSTQKLSPAVARSLRAKALRLGLNADKLVKDVAVATLETVVKRTPHDTGEARAGWAVTVRVSRPHTTPFKDKLDYDGDATIAEGTATILTTPRPDGHSIYISNAQPHILPLNQGWSTQAPAGFVELAVQAGAQVARNAKILKRG